MLWALDEPPTDALAELRGVLLAEHEWRVREVSRRRTCVLGRRTHRCVLEWGEPAL